MSREIKDSAVSLFLDDVTDQISYKPLRPSIRQELESHIEDRINEYESQGLSANEAEQKALHGMGDAIAIGTDLNDLHKLQKAPLLSLSAVLLLLIGFAFSCFVRWTPEQSANGFLYYIPGGILLILTARKGYPFLVRHRKSLTIFVCLLYLIQIVRSMLLHYQGLMFRTPSTAYFATLLFIPLITILLYCSRKNRKKFYGIAFGCIGVWIYFFCAINRYISETAIMILLLSTLSTICFMIHRGILPGKKKYLYSGALIILALLGSPMFFTTSGRIKTAMFLSPQTNVSSMWDDTYNSVLIQELLSRTPATHGLLLSPDEMMNYGTGAWYFTSRDPKQMGIDATGIRSQKQQQEFEEKVKALRNQGYSPRYIHYSEENVTLWNILPQHYHNNYVIAVCIFLFGWLPGLLMIGIISLFYLLLFRHIRRIHGHLASSLAFCCAQGLLWQGVLYLLGNFGYQYATFPNLPLISEGRLSILFNMLLLGLIFSAYRHDHVMGEPLELPAVTSG